MIRFLTYFLALYFVQSKQQQSNKPKIPQIHNHIKCNNLTDVGKYYLNECKLRCECTFRENLNITCFRERENYACMSSERKQRFHQAIITISNPTNPLYNSMQALIQKHSDEFVMIHI